MYPQSRRRALAVAFSIHATLSPASPELPSPPVNTDNRPTHTSTPAPELRAFADGGLIVWYASEVFIDQHHSSFDIPLGRVRIDKLDTYRHLWVWREYDIPPHTIAADSRAGVSGDASIKQRPNRHPRHVERYEHARLDDFVVDPDGYATHSALRPLHATSAFIRPATDSADWIIVTGLEPGTTIRVTDAMGRTRDHVYGPNATSP